MAFVGQVVGLGDDLGRVCCINTFEETACVQFRDGGCLKVAVNALQPAEGNPPDCTAGCFEGC